MTHPHRTRLIGAAMLAAGAVVAGLLSSNTAAASAGSPPVLATGTITFPAGAASGQVLAFADPNQATLMRTATGQTLKLALVSSANAAPDGSFTLTLDPATVPPSRVMPDGSINMDVIAVSGGRQQVYFLPVKLTHTATGAAFVSITTSPAPATPRLSFDMSGGSATNVRYDARRWLSDSGRLLPARTVATLSADTTVPATPTTASIAAAVAADTSPAALCLLHPGDRIEGRPEHFVNAYTDNNDAATVHVTESTTATHTLGVAVDFGGTWHQSGAANISKTDGASATSTDRQVSWSYWNKVNYRKFFDSCIGRYQRPTGFYEILDASRGGRVDMLWLSASCGVHDAGSKWNTQDATAATFGTGVDLPVVKVSAQTGFGSDENVHYTFDHKAEIVGNNVRGPVHSSKVEADTSWRVCVQR